MTPFKLITVFLHEVSHALACLLTCGKVRTCFIYTLNFKLSDDELQQNVWLALVLLNIRQVMTHISLQVEGIKVHADEGGVTQTRGGVYWLILPAGCNFI